MKKTLTIALAFVLVIAISVAGTFAYLTSQDKVVNTFTFGDINIKLVETDNTKIDGSTTGKGNEYKLIPGVEYTKDPTVTVLEGSEPCYVRMFVTITNYSTFQEIVGNGLPETFVGGWDPTVWVSTKVLDVNTTDDICTLEFRYKDEVNAADGAKELPALFETIKVPDTLDADDVEALAVVQIEVVAQAVQSASFNGDMAAAFDAAGVPNA